jgi:putative effector of murein hydrolase
VQICRKWMLIPNIVSNCTLCPIVCCILSCSFLLYLQMRNDLYSAMNVCITKFIFKAEVLFALNLYHTYSYAHLIWQL